MAYRPQRTTIFVSGGTVAPARRACLRPMPLPVLSTSSPAAAACSSALRTGRPMSKGTRRLFSPATMTVDVADCDSAGGCIVAGWGGITLPSAAFVAEFGGLALVCDWPTAAGRAEVVG